MKIEISNDQAELIIDSLTDKSLTISDQELHDKYLVLIGIISCEKGASNE